MTASRRLVVLAGWVTLTVVVGGVAWTTRVGTRWPASYCMEGPSMEPTIRAGACFLAWRPVDRWNRGDLVLFRFLDGDEEFHVVRRLVALPGDTVEMDMGAVITNGDAMPWPFRILAPRASHSPLAIEPDLYTWGPWIVPPDSVVLLADTRDMVGWPDSRFVGFVAKKTILARATRTVLGRRLE